MKKKIAKTKYTLEHRKAYIRTAKELGVFSFRHYFHDLDKLFLYFIFDLKKASKIHRNWSRHHNKAKTKNDYIDMVIDWECARFTKPDKPLNARETLNAYYPELTNKVEPVLQELGL